MPIVDVGAGVYPCFAATRTLLQKPMLLPRNPRPLVHPMLTLVRLTTLLLVGCSVGFAQTCLDRVDPAYSAGVSDFDMSGDRLIVGYSSADISASDDGAAVVYLRNPQTGDFEVEAMLEPGLGSGAQIGATALIEGGLAVLRGPQAVCLYEFDGTTWGLASVISAAAGQTFQEIATNGTEVYVSLDSPSTLVLRKLGGTWQEVGQIPSGGSRVLACNAGYVVVRRDIYRLDPFFGFVSEGSISTPREASRARMSVAFDDDGAIHYYLNRNRHRTVRDPSTGTWSTLNLPGSGDQLSTGTSSSEFRGITFSDGLMVVFGRFSSGPIWSVGGRALSLGADLFGSLSDIEWEIPGSRLFAAANRRATSGSSILEVDEWDCERVSERVCSQSVPNSTGEEATLVAGGSLSIMANDLTLVAGNLPLNSFGYFLTSRASGFTANPGGSQGNLCLTGNIGRYVGPGQIQNSGATGSISLTLDLAAMPSPTGSVSAAAGENWYFQLWHRDANPTIESNFTDSARVLLTN